MARSAPRVFTSYSHDDDAHKRWVLTLADRLVRNGVDVILDQWNLRLGGDLARFMEVGLTDTDRVLAVCSADYVRKANAGQGGVGYEKMILTGRLMGDLTSEHVIPVIRANNAVPLVPTFLSSRVYTDFRADADYEARYTELLREIHGHPVTPRPPLGANPFEQVPLDVEPRISFTPERYVSPTSSGTVTFDYSNNNGRYVVGAGDMAFETAWSGGSTSSIHAYANASSTRTVAIATGAAEIVEIANAANYDTSSDARSPRLGEVATWQNTAGYWLATKIEQLQSRSHGSPKDEVTFSYVIAPSKSSDFRARR